MLASGDWIAPHLLGLRYFEKPIAGYWINSIGQWRSGANNFGGAGRRYLSCLLSTACGDLVLLALISAINVWLTRHSSSPRFVHSYAIATHAALDLFIAFWLVECAASGWQCSSRPWK
ncbi:phospholipid carrier-dependent glycosyltransferase [Escherichia coli]